MGLKPSTVYLNTMHNTGLMYLPVDCDAFVDTGHITQSHLTITLHEKLAPETVMPLGVVCDKSPRASRATSYQSS
jgi:hypothetical protein